MNNDYIFFKASDGHSLAYKVWNNVDSPQGIIILIHGMAEHIERYDNFAQFLNSKNYVVYGLDQRGHGKTSGRRGFFHSKKGWKKAVNDQVEFYNLIKGSNTNLKISYIGHSMGSYILRYLLAEKVINPSKVIISGTGYTPVFICKIAKTLAGFISYIKGKSNSAVFLDKMVNGPFTKSIKNPVSKFDWLSRDPNQVAKYINDTECGFICTNKFYHDFFTIITETSKKSKMKKIDPELPILIFSGENDPVGGRNAKDVITLHSILKKLDLDVSIHINPKGRHENTNEINKKEVYTYFYDFIS